MIIGVISDTHDKLETIERALTFFASQKVELIIHCGDWKAVNTMETFAARAYELGIPVRAVLGNRDEDPERFVTAAAESPGFTLNTLEDVIVTERGSIAVTHGHHKPTVRQLEEIDPSMLLLGHSHKPRIEKVVRSPLSTRAQLPFPFLEVRLGSRRSHSSIQGSWLLA